MSEFFQSKSDMISKVTMVKKFRERYIKALSHLTESDRDFNYQEVSEFSKYLEGLKAMEQFIADQLNSVSSLINSKKLLATYKSQELAELDALEMELDGILNS